MKHLSAREISDLCELLGSFAQVGLAAACESRANPKEWAAGNGRPNDAEMKRLVVLKEALEKVAKKKGNVAARQWALSPNCHVDNSRVSPITAVSLDKFKAVRDAAQ